MSTVGSREEMLEALQKAKQAMARRVHAAAPAEAPEGTGALQVRQDSATSRPRPPPAASEAKDNRSHFFDTWCRKIEMFVADPTKTVLELPKELAPNDRRELHSLAEKYNLSHQSRGTGAVRQLVLKKDSLHYRMPDARPENIEALKQNAGEKQSKFHLRRMRRDPDAAIGSIGAFGDEATANMVRRLDRATDEYRRAVEVGYTHEELLSLEAGETVEEILRRTDATGPAGVADHEATVNSSNNNNNSSDTLPVSINTAGEAAHHIGTGKKGPVAYDEVCLRCGSRARVDYDVQKWECNGYCAQCTMQTIWKLVEVHDAAEELVIPTATADRKRGRQEMEMNAPSPVQEPEEIDKDNGEDDTITVEDVVDMASMNDFSAADINWIRRFARHHQPLESKNILSDHIVFCIEFDDLFSMRIFRAFLTPKEITQEAVEQKRSKDEPKTTTEEREEDHTAWFVLLREVKAAGVPLSTLLEELAACVPEGYDRLAIAFPNMSVYGTEATCVCLIRPGAMREGGLEEMQRKYGRHSVRFAHELGALLRKDGEPA
ncbi:hypothetical protein DQ04_01711110 [Trypanosoma grayi]|uniref:hypothetical protein n=1 Tax=Trypanosoma grayi TaxID=71804 RepID=UPI0004F418C3|nr:hypothetical protein DQ04_01711110 [Trypanosoma grayi]KEG12448.1 hypothetical protein DQ04_01711110 [Trypanosoma grayi]